MTFPVHLMCSDLDFIEIMALQALQLTFLQSFATLFHPLIFS